MQQKRRPRPKLRYKGSSESRQKKADANELGFGDLLKENQQSRRESLREMADDVRSTLNARRQKAREQSTSRKIERAKTQKSQASKQSPPVSEWISAPIRGYKFLHAKLGAHGARAIVFVLVMVMLPVLIQVISRQRHSGDDNAGEVAGVSEELEESTEGFTPVLPIDLTNDEDVQPSFDQQRNIVTLKDVNPLGEFTITQQLLPFEFTPEQGGIKNLALSLSDKQKISQIELNTGAAYVIDQTSGQAVVSSRGDVLIFITSPKIVSDEDWVNYLNSLN